MKKHINNVCNILSKKIGMLYRIRNFVSRNKYIGHDNFTVPSVADPGGRNTVKIGVLK